MLRRTGQAVADLGTWTHRICGLFLTLALVFGLGCAALAWRLSKGPLDLAVLRPHIERALGADVHSRVHLGSVSIAWNGFSQGLNQPLVLRVRDLSIIPANGAASVRIPAAEAGLSVRALLIGRLKPRTVALQSARLLMIRQPDGKFRLDLGGPDDPDDTTSPLTGLLLALGAPAGSDLKDAGGRFSQLTALSIRDATLVLIDRSLSDRPGGRSLTARRGNLELVRHPGGGLDGHAEATMIPDEGSGVPPARLTIRVSLAPKAETTTLSARIVGLDPRILADAAPALGSLAHLEALIDLDAEAALGPDFQPANVRVTAHLGSGRFKTAEGQIAFTGADVVMSGVAMAGGPLKAALERASITLQPKANGPVTAIGATGQFSHAAGVLAAALHITVDHAAFADLASLWPADLNRPFRAWMVTNVLAGTARDGKFDLRVETPDDASRIALTQATGTLKAENLTVVWMPKVPAMEQGQATLTVTDPDKAEIEIKSGRQKVNGADPIAITGGHVTIVGLSKKDQVATIRAEPSGPVTSVIALLREPGLRLLSRHPMELRNPAGDARFTLRLTVPLESNLSVDDVTINGTGTVAKLHLSAIAAGRDLDDVAAKVDFDVNGLTFNGTGRLAGIAANLDGMMDFRSGPASQLTRRYTVSARPTGQALATAGLDTMGSLTGELGLNAVYSRYRGGDAEVLIDADLARSALTLAPIGWTKTPGGAAKASMRVVLAKDDVVGIERIAADGPGIQVRASAGFVRGKPDAIKLDRVLLGRTDLSGTIRLPPKAAAKGTPDAPMVIELAGPGLDLSAKLLEKSGKSASIPAMSLRARFDRVWLAHDQIASGVLAAVEHDGEIFRGVDVTGKLDMGKSGGWKSVSMRIGGSRAADGKPTRAIAIAAEDAGLLLAGFDITETIQHGVLSIDGIFDDTRPDHPLSGLLTMTEFRVARAPALGKLLQAVTLYGLVDALAGPGLGFSKLEAPFEIDETMITVHDARSFSASLGLTAKGRIDRAGHRVDLEGTLVPAYVFNSLLGRIPVIGRLFSAETGGGLIAMNYSLRGPTDDPSVLANPFSAVTPGILRRMFGLFDGAPLDQRPARDNAQAQ